MNLESHIGQTEWKEFTDRFRRKVPAIFVAPRPGRFQALWSDWELDAICRFTPLPESDTFRLFKAGKHVPSAAYLDRRGVPSLATLRQLWASGVSINFARLEFFSNPVLAVVRQLEAELQSPARVHFFATPAQSQGLGVHADHADVLVLQVQGEKTWDIYRTAEPWRPGAPDTNVALQGHTPETVTLGPGGWLYLPRGVYHEVRNKGDAPSTHFTIGFHALTWRRLLERALELAHGKVPQLDDAVAVPGPLGADEGEIARRLGTLRPLLDAALEADRYGHAVPAEALVPRGDLDAASAATRFAWRRDGVAVRTVAARIDLSLSYRSTPVSLRAEFASTIEWMTARETFAAAELPHEPETAVLLCKFLANVGVLRLAHPGPG